MYDFFAYITTRDFQDRGGFLRGDTGVNHSLHGDLIKDLDACNKRETGIKICQIFFLNIFDLSHQSMAIKVVSEMV